MRKTKKLLLLALTLVGLLIFAGCSNNSAEDSVVDESNTGTETNEEKASQEVKMVYTMEDFNPPSMNDVPEGPLGEAIKFGYQLMNETNTLLDEYVGNELSCSSCHGNAGLDMSSPLVGVTALSPEYNPRAGVVLTIEDRINGCMKRSMNGTDIPYNSTEMRAMVSYLTYISSGIPVGAELPWRQLNTLVDPPTPDLANGEALYAQVCSAYHLADGSGIGANSGPALWGENSYNDGAGIARLSKAAGYIQRNMPKGEMGGIKQGELTDQQATDIAAFMNSQDRPKWPGRAKDWPHGGAPKDVPYFDELESMK